MPGTVAAPTLLSSYAVFSYCLFISRYSKQNSNQFWGKSDEQHSEPVFGSYPSWTHPAPNLSFAPLPRAPRLTTV